MTFENKIVEALVEATGKSADLCRDALNIVNKRDGTIFRSYMSEAGDCPSERIAAKNNYIKESREFQDPELCKEVSDLLDWEETKSGFYYKKGFLCCNAEVSEEVLQEGEFLIIK